MSYQAGGKLAMRREAERSVAFLFRQGGWQHCSGINSLVLSPDERHLWTASRDALIKRWDLSGLQPALEADLEGHIDWVNAVVLANRDVVVSASSDKTLRVWRADGAGQRGGACWQGHGDYVTALAAASAAPLVASAGLRGELILWDLEVLKPAVTAVAQAEGASPRPPGTWVKGMAGSIYSLATDASGMVVAAGTSEGSIWLLDVRSGRCETALHGHSGNVRALAMTPDAGGLLLSGSSDHTLRLWDLRQLRSTQTFAVHTDSVWALAVDPSFSQVYSGGRDGCVYRTHLASRGSELLAVEDQPVQALAIGGGGETIWAATTSSTLHCWRTAPPGGADAGLGARSFTAGSLPAVRSRMSFDGSGSRPRAQQLRPAASIPGTPPVRHVAVLTDRRHVLTQDAQGQVLLWDVTAGAVVREMGQVALKDAERLLFDPAHNISPWFQPDTRLGCLAGYMEAGQCFLAEAYQRDLGNPSAPADAKLNMGEHMLKALFQRWVERRAAAAAGASDDVAMRDAEGNASADGTGAPPAGAAAAGAGVQAGSAFHLRAPVAPVVLISGGAGLAPLRRATDSFTGREREGEEVPQWVADCVLHSHFPNHKSVAADLKMFFNLQPAEGSGLPSLLQGRLSAPRVLGVDKVADYVLRKMADSGVALREEPLFWAAEKQEVWEAEHAAARGERDDSGAAAGGPANAGGGGMLGLGIRQLRPVAAATAQQDPPLLITCNGAAVPWDFTLAAVRQWMWKRPEDLKLEYGIRQAGVELRPPVIRPPV